MAFIFRANKMPSSSVNGRFTSIVGDLDDISNGLVGASLARQRSTTENSFSAPNFDFSTILGHGNDERVAHTQLLEGSVSTKSGAPNDEAKTYANQIAPLFSRKVRNAVQSGELAEHGMTASNAFPQYGLLGLR